MAVETVKSFSFLKIIIFILNPVNVFIVSNLENIL